VVSYERVPLPTARPGEPAPEISASIDAWIRSRPLRDVVKEFGGDVPDLATGPLLAWLDDFSAEQWDFRRRTAERAAALRGADGRVERDQVQVPEFAPSTVDIIDAVAVALGLADSLPPPRQRYDHLLVLGGLARACLQRTAHAARLTAGGTEVGHVAALGSFRPLGTHEVELLDRLGGAGCAYEVDAMDVGIRSAYGYERPTREQRSADAGEVTNLSWLVRSYRSAGQPPVDVLAAPSTEPEQRRANTPDTYHFWARQVTLAPGDWVLVVTSPIYVPFQHCDAIRALALPYGCGVDTVGFDPGPAGELSLWQGVTPDRYLQEFRSAIWSMRHLFEALV
jgi:hypothetical protein